MKTKKHRHFGCGGCCIVFLAAGFLMLVVFVCMLQMLRPTDGASQQPASQQQSFYKTEYLDKSESLYRYSDPETGIYSMAGIDVSEHQGTLDWNFWHDSGLEFVFIRAGYRGYGTGAIVEDSRYQANLAEAKAAGLKCGVYFYSQAISAEEAREEADFVLTLLDGAALEMPVVYDWETPDSEDARTWALPEETLQENAVAFCEEIRAGGYTPMLYANAGIYEIYRQKPELDDVDIWYAQYTDGKTYADEYSIWQYTQTGSVNGSLSIDLNLAYLDSEGNLLSAEKIAQLRQ